MCEDEEVVGSLRRATKDAILASCDVILSGLRICEMETRAVVAKRESGILARGGREVGRKTRSSRLDAIDMLFQMRQVVPTFIE